MLLQNMQKRKAKKRTERKSLLHLFRRFIRLPTNHRGITFSFVG